MSQCWIVVHRIGGLIVFDSWFVQRTSCSRFGVGDAFDCGEYPFADFRFVAAKRELALAIDGERRILIGDGGSAVALPSDVTVDLLGTTVPSRDRATIVRFHPDGASSGAVLVLSREKAGYEIRVNWYTGGVSVEGCSLRFSGSCCQGTSRRKRSIRMLRAMAKIQVAALPLSST